MTNERGDDLIVSFAVDAGFPGDVLSVILMRTPKYERFLYPWERGVRVTHDRYPELDDEYLLRFALREGLVEITTTRRTYLLDVSRVDSAELTEAEHILRKMNFDRDFELVFE